MSGGTKKKKKKWKIVGIKNKFIVKRTEKNNQNWNKIDSQK